MDSRVSAANRIAILASKDEILFHISDVANLWEVTDKNVLRKMLSRYTQRGLMVRVHRGFYSLKKISEIDPYLLGVKALHGPAYISCETILFRDGIINQPAQGITIVSSVSKYFTIAGIAYKSRKMRDEFLFNNAGIEVQSGVRVASSARAIADIYYFNPRKYLDALGSSLVDMDEVREIQKAVGFKLSKKS